MQLIKAVQNRHSVRAFEKKKIPKSTIKKLVKLATMAPSAGNRQPWIFYCIDNKNKRNQISELLKSTLEIFKEDIEKKENKIKNIILSFYSDLGGSQNLIFIFRKKSKKEEAHTCPNDIASISCAAQNIMLCAQEFGLGTCWIGSFNGPQIEPKLKTILNAKNDEELVCSLIIGFPKKGFKKLKRTKKKLNEIIKFI